MTVDYSNRNDFERIKNYLDENSIEMSSKSDLTENWILDTIRHYNDNNISYDSEETILDNKELESNAIDHTQIGRFDVPSFFCSTPLLQLKNQDLVNRFESAYSEITNRIKAQCQYLEDLDSFDDIKDNEDDRSRNTQSLIDDTIVEENDTVKLDHTISNLITPEPSYSNFSRNWLKDYLMQHSTDLSQREKNRKTDDCIVIKLKPALKSNVCKRINLQTIVKEKYLRGMKCKEY